MSPRVTKPPTQAGLRRASLNGILYPLDVLYAQVGVPQPVARRADPARIPPPYRALLVHENEMTQTLERHIGGPLAIRVLWSATKGRWYSRRSLLVEEASGRPVAMGALRINLDAFSARIRARILRGQAPLGRVLREGGVACLSRPSALLEVTPNGEMMGVFWMREATTLYGRQTEMFLGDSRIGHIVEILQVL